MTVAFVAGSGLMASTVASERLPTMYLFASNRGETLQLEIVQTATETSRKYVLYVFNGRGATSFPAGPGFALGAAAALDRGTSLTRMTYDDGTNPGGLSPADQAARRDQMAHRTAELLSQLA